MFSQQPMNQKVNPPSKDFIALINARQEAMPFHDPSDIREAMVGLLRYVHHTQPRLSLKEQFKLLQSIPLTNELILRLRQYNGSVPVASLWFSFSQLENQISKLMQACFEPASHQCAA